MRRELHIDGPPIPKGRPRVAGGQAYTPQRTRDAETAIGWAWKAEHGGDPMPGHMRVQVDFLEGPGSSPADLDNYVKLVLDALNGLAWTDDRQVIRLKAHVGRKARASWTHIIVDDFDSERQSD